MDAKTAEPRRYVIKTCHTGVDWCVSNAEPDEDPDCIFTNLSEAIKRGREIVRELNDGRAPGISPCKFWDFSDEDPECIYTE